MTKSTKSTSFSFRHAFPEGVAENMPLSCLMEIKQVRKEGLGKTDSDGQIKMPFIDAILG